MGMSNAERDDAHDGAPDEHSIQDGQRIDEASGQKVGPPGQGDLDEGKFEEAAEELKQAGGGH